MTKYSSETRIFDRALIKKNSPLYRDRNKNFKKVFSHGNRN